MAAGKTLNAANLERLGAARLAALLIEVSRGNAGAADATRMVAKRLTSIAGARTWLNWQKIKPFAAELELQHRTVLELIAPSDPREAFELLWRLVGCAGAVFARSDDGSGRLAATFRSATRDLGPLAQRVSFPPEDLSGRVVRALTANEAGVQDELIPAMASQLGTAGLNMVRDAIHRWATEPDATTAGRRMSPITRADGTGSWRRKQTASLALRQVADALGDVDGFIAQFDIPARSTPAVSADIARRLLAAGRPREAWAALEQVTLTASDEAVPDDAVTGWEEARVAVLETLGRADEVQVFRWQRFLQTLNAAHLRAHLRTLTDFDDVEAEQRALDHAVAFADVHRALAFLLAWPDLHRASALVLERAVALDGNRYELLTPAAEALDARHLLAATVLRRAMIVFVLGAGRSSRYRHAARHLLACRAGAASVPDFGHVPNHPSFERRLRVTYGRKTGFWQEVDAAS